MGCFMDYVPHKNVAKMQKKNKAHTWNLFVEISHKSQMRKSQVETLIARERTNDLLWVKNTRNFDYRV